ncbi:helical backbone metal receptor [Nocardioides sp. S-58]|uniref:Helical backbone metal receptor n=1 Tax=Nocardioides renjunii TaxID=3095075 RepID=A0ABU5KEE1_9ACTN|nr:helical backbone metal receptor [Nocardioides sp. S-58]MDZ5663321.1 helical backbone metal receptor [Nocardioides sp. S-58]
MRDDLGADVPLGAPASRVVSLVPSLTEALAASAPDRLVGATEWCTHPADLDVARVRGTKNPDLAAVRALSPDLVVANMEENRELDVRRLREAGVAVWVTRIETVEDALASMSRLFAEALDLADPGWLVEARGLWSSPAPARLRVAVPIWRDPWMVVGSPTYTDDLLTRAGLVNVLAGRDGRYPPVTPADIDGAGADVVLLPDEPYVFTADDGPEALATPTRLVSGRLLTWYGPAMVEAHAVLTALHR